MSRKKPIRTEGSASRIRGRLVEAIVAAMHAAPGVQVRQNVRLSSLSGVGRSREFDVLVDGSVAGYPIRIPIECKNEKQLIGAERIDAFIGKLQHVGLAPQQAIYVSVKGFTKDAVARAKAAGMKTLVLTGLAPERLEAAVLEAMQAVVYLWPVAVEWEVRNDIPGPIEAGEDLGVYRDEKGAIIGSVADLAWRAWIEGRTPQTLGRHAVELKLPRGWRNVVHGNESLPERVSVTLEVFGIVMSERGTAHRHALVDVETRVIEKLRLSAAFRPDASTTPEVFADEADLVRFLREMGAQVRVTSRIRLPRIQWMGAFWPLSIRVAEALNEMSKPDDEGRIPNPGPADIERAEQPHFSNMWEPLWFSPLLKGILEAEFEEPAG